MIIDITNEILTDIKLLLKGTTVLSSYQPTINSFPVVIVEESANSAHTPTEDSGGFNHSNIGVSIEIYTRGSDRMTQAKEIRNEIDNLLSVKYKMVRGNPSILPNYMDNTIYRYRLNYTGLISKDKIIYRG